MVGGAWVVAWQPVYHSRPSEECSGQKGSSSEGRPGGQRLAGGVAANHPLTIASRFFLSSASSICPSVWGGFVNTPIRQGQRYYYTHPVSWHILTAGNISGDLSLPLILTSSVESVHLSLPSSPCTSYHTITPSHITHTNKIYHCILCVCVCVCVCVFTSEFSTSLRRCFWKRVSGWALIEAST